MKSLHQKTLSTNETETRCRKKLPRTQVGVLKVDTCSSQGNKMGGQSGRTRCDIGTSETQATAATGGCSECTGCSSPVSGVKSNCERCQVHMRGKNHAAKSHASPALPFSHTIICAKVTPQRKKRLRHRNPYNGTMTAVHALGTPPTHTHTERNTTTYHRPRKADTKSSPNIATPKARGATTKQHQRQHPSNKVKSVQTSHTQT